jgi:hypothetical protein
MTFVKKRLALALDNRRNSRQTVGHRSRAEHVSERRNFGWMPLRRVKPSQRQGYGDVGRASRPTVNAPMTTPRPRHPEAWEVVRIHTDIDLVESVKGTAYPACCGASRRKS